MEIFIRVLLLRKLTFSVSFFKTRNELKMHNTKHIFWPTLLKKFKNFHWFFFHIFKTFSNLQFKFKKVLDGDVRNWFLPLSSSRLTQWCAAVLSGAAGVSCSAGDNWYSLQCTGKCQSHPAILTSCSGVKILMKRCKIL